MPTPADDAADEREGLLSERAGSQERDREPRGGSTIAAALTALYVVAYLLVGPSLILVNKRLLKEAGFPYPMMVSGLGQASSALGAFVCIRLVGVQTLQHTTFSWQFYIKNMMVVGAATAASLCFGNAGYIYLTVSFVQILKAFTPVFVVAMLGITGIDTPSRAVVASVLMISVGTAIASLGEANFNATGLLIMFLAETCEATRLVLTQKLLTNMKFEALEGLYWMSPICTLWMWGLSAFIELPAALRDDAFTPLMDQHAGTVLLAATLGFAVNLASFLVIKRTSSTTLKLLGTARNAGLVLFSACFLGEHVTPTQGFGYAVSLGFFGVYNYVKARKL